MKHPPAEQIMAFVPNGYNLWNPTTMQITEFPYTSDDPNLGYQIGSKPPSLWLDLVPALLHLGIGKILKKKIPWNHISFNFFRGFIQERAFQKEQGKPVGETHLYFGCRHKDKDFIYREELEKYVDEGVLNLHTAFSRDQVEKVYVTHKLREDMDHLWEMIGD